MAEPIDPNTGLRGESPSEIAEQPGLSPSLWEGETEIPRTLGNSPPPTSWHGWLAIVVAVGSACVVLAVGSIATWRIPNPQNAPQAQLGQAVTLASNHSSSGGLPAEEPTDKVPQVPPSPHGAGQSRQLAVTSSSGAASESQASESKPSGDDNRRNVPRPQPEVASAATKSPAAYRWAINRTRSALVARDLKRAQRQLEIAARHADSPVQNDQLAQFRALNDQLDRFWAAVRAGLKALEPAEELHVDNVIAAVVESGPESLALFVAGSRRDYTLANLPTKVALLLVERAASEDAPANQVFLGAFHAVDPRGDLNRARQLWESAAAAGESVNDLLPFLDPKALAIEREPIPDAQQVAAAEQTIERKFAGAIEAAKTAQRKSQLAASLISAVADAESSLDQYALLKQATRWAIAAAEPQSALRAIDERARWFEVDAWTLKSDALTQALESSVPTVARQIAMSALELSAEAMAQGRGEPAQALIITAQAAARKARDRELIKRAAQRRLDVEKLEKQPGQVPSASE
ncbi:MAG: hypothetical protein HY288_15150 [Planctomycetia bacterium]|nr:hypothetical protein [Planctomycetia bacterium]